MNESFESVSSLDPIRNYFRKVGRVLSRPTQFFSELNPPKGLSGPLAFALVTHWLARLIEYCWSSSFGGGMVPYWKRLFDSIQPQTAGIDGLRQMPWFLETRGLVMNWFWGTGSIIIDPFLSIIKILLHSLILFVAARLLVPSRTSIEAQRSSFESIVQVVCYGMTPALFTVVPFIGAPAAALYTLVVTLIGLAITLQIGFGRALIIALFPQILIAGAVLAGAMALLLFFVKFFSSF